MVPVLAPEKIRALAGITKVLASEETRGLALGEIAILENFVFDLTGGSVVESRLVNMTMYAQNVDEIIMGLPRADNEICVQSMQMCHWCMIKW